MSSHDKFRLTIPAFKIRDEKDEEANVRAIERWANGPFNERITALEDRLSAAEGDAGTTVIIYATGGVVVNYTRTFDAAPIPVCALEGPAGTNPYVVYIASPTTTGFTAVIFAGSGVETAAGGAFRLYWHARPAGV